MSARTNAPHQSFMEGKWHAQAAALFRANSGISAVGLKWSSGSKGTHNSLHRVEVSCMMFLFSSVISQWLVGPSLLVWAQMVPLSGRQQRLLRYRRLYNTQEVMSTDHSLSCSGSPSSHSAFDTGYVSPLGHVGKPRIHWTSCFRLPHWPHL